MAAASGRPACERSYTVELQPMESTRGKSMLPIASPSKNLASIAANNGRCKCENRGLQTIRPAELGFASGQTMG